MNFLQFTAMNMATRAPALCFLFLAMKGAEAQIALTQTESLAVSPGESASIICKTSENVGNCLNWYRQTPGQAPTPLISLATKRAPGVPARFSGSRSVNDFTLSISRVEAGDAAVYHCQHCYYSPWTFGAGTKVEIKRDDAAPSVFIFPPSAEQLSGGTASLLCLLNAFYPADAQVTWKADDKVITKDVENSSNMPDTNNTYSRSSMVTFSKAEWEGYAEITCEVTHKALTSPLKKSITKQGCA